MCCLRFRRFCYCMSVEAGTKMMAFAHVALFAALTVYKLVNREYSEAALDATTTGL